MKCSFSPGRGQSIAANFPVPVRVIYAVLRPGPPKQIFVVRGSPVGMNSTDAPSGEMTVIPPLISVATQTFPALSTASESRS